VSGARTVLTAVPLSDIEGVAWPAMPGASAARMLALQQQLAHSQWWPPERHRLWQFRQLRPLLEHAFRTVPFHRPRLAAAGYQPGQEITEELWPRLPLLTRVEVRAAGAAVRSTEVPRQHGGIGQTDTSGSTGTPIKVPKTALEQTLWSAFALREELWHRRDWGARVAVIRGMGNATTGERKPNWGPPLAGIFATGPVTAFEIRSDVRRQAEWLRRVNPDYLLTFGTNIAFLCQEFRAQGWTLPRLREVRSVGEVIEPETRRLCREVWGVGITDVYSCEEAGYLAFQCPGREHYHVQMEGVLLEVLDERGRPCAPGETGRVVATPLHNYAMPFIRYELGDIAEVGPPCPCGRGLQVLTRMVGRARDLVRLPTGEKRYAWQSPAKLAEIEPILRYQVAQVALDELEVRLVATRALTPAEEEAFRRAVIANLGYEFRFRFVYREELPRASGGKYFVFRSELDAGGGG
jgi:phenylacetate-CoA ligase